MIDPVTTLLRRLESLGLDAYEIYTSESRLFSASAKGGEIEITQEADERGAAIRIGSGRRTAFACTSAWTKDFLDKMVDQAHASLPHLSEEEPLPLAGPLSVAPLNTPAGVVPRGDAMEFAIRLEKAACAYDAKVRRVRDARYAEETRTVRIVNSKGLSCEGRSSRFSLSLLAVAQGEGDDQMAWDELDTDRPEALDPEALGRSVAEKAVSQLGARPVPTQKAPVVLDASVVCSLLGVLSSSFSADQIQKNRSALKGRSGETIYSPKVGITDDGNLNGGFGSFPFDAEGVASRTTILVQAGRIESFLYDLRSSAREKGTVSSTGNAVRSHFKDPPHVGGRNFFIESGSGSLEDLLREMDRGLWVRDVIGVHTADAVSGDFSLGASGIWIAKGKRDRPVRGITIAGNLHQLLKSVESVGKDRRFYHAYGAPPLLMSEIEIGGAS